VPSQLGNLATCRLLPNESAVRMADGCPACCSRSKSSGIRPATASIGICHGGELQVSTRMLQPVLLRFGHTRNVSEQRETSSHHTFTSCDRRALFWLTVLVLIAVHVRLARPDSRTLNQECSDEVSRSGVRLIIWRPDPSKNPLTVCMRHCRRQNVQDSPCRTALKHALYSVGLIAREFEDTKIK
jgi:hypothetical protein